LIRRAIASGRRQNLYADHLALSADGTEGDINTTDSEQLLLPGLGLVFFFCYDLAITEKRTA
jgi:hypothetical protein